MSKSVLVPIADGSEDIEAVTLIDVLRRAQAQLIVASVKEDDLAVTAARGTRIIADTLINKCAAQNFDLIALPGGLPGADIMSECEILIAMLKQQKARGGNYAAICASPARVLEVHGLLAGKRATCYPSMAGELVEGKYVAAPVVVDANCITSQGPGTAMLFALQLVEILFGKNLRQTIAKQLLV
ncbi:MAG: DJ-1/PfpI family protein [Cyanobacteria bacterium J083]|nr:MAG: DJ-1/PfpI family protein [Cyanobacteria bacterium J083]